MICDAKGFRSKNWKYFNKFWIDTVHYSSKKGIMYKGTNSQPLFYFLRFQSPKSVRIQTISFHNKVFLRISKMKNLMADPFPSPCLSDIDLVVLQNSLFLTVGPHNEPVQWGFSSSSLLTSLWCLFGSLLTFVSLGGIWEGVNSAVP